MKRNVFIGSLATVAAVGTIGVNVAQASPSGMKNTRYHVAQSEMLVSHPDMMTSPVDVQEHVSDERDNFLASRGSRRMRHQCIKDAIENNDWETYQQVVHGKKAAAIIDTPEKFAQLVEAHDLYRQGRNTEAEELLKDLHVHDHQMWRQVNR